MADIRDLKSRGEKSPCGFDSRLGHPFSPTIQSLDDAIFADFKPEKYAVGENLGSSPLRPITLADSSVRRFRWQQD